MINEVEFIVMRALQHGFLTKPLKVKSDSSSVFRDGKHAERVRPLAAVARDVAAGRPLRPWGRRSLAGAVAEEAPEVAPPVG